MKIERRSSYFDGIIRRSSWFSVASVLIMAPLAVYLEHRSNELYSEIQGNEIRLSVQDAQLVERDRKLQEKDQMIQERDNSLARMARKEAGIKKRIKEFTGQLESSCKFSKEDADATEQFLTEGRRELPQINGTTTSTLLDTPWWKRAGSTPCDTRQ